MRSTINWRTCSHKIVASKTFSLRKFRRWLTKHPMNGSVNGFMEVPEAVLSADFFCSYHRFQFSSLHAQVSFCSRSSARPRQNDA